jgi:hypothetical protein
LVPTSQMNPVHIVTRSISVTCALLLPSLLELCLENSLFPAGLPSKILYAFLSAPLRPTCLIHLSSSLTSLYVILTTVVHPLGIYLQFCILTFNFTSIFLIIGSSVYYSIVSSLCWVHGDSVETTLFGYGMRTHEPLNSERPE